MKHPITTLERMVIESGIRTGKSNRSIATCLGRRHSTINYEVRVNSGTRARYRAQTAERLSAERRQQDKTRKLDKPCNKELKKYVICMMKEEDWSPDAIAGRLKESPPAKLAGKTISHEAIYDYIYNGPGRYLGLYTHLKRSSRKRKKQRIGVYKKKSGIPSKVSIHQRPAEVASRRTLGHWESDTVEGGHNGSKEVLSVQFERMCRVTKIHKLKNKTASETLAALEKTIEQFPLQMMKSITFDNGKESVKHVLLRKKYGIQTYHCDPYASWQKGSVEQANGLIRYYIPKGTDIANYSDDDIQCIEDRLNNTPRKSLNYLTPYEALDKMLSGQTIS